MHRLSALSLAALMTATAALHAPRAEGALSRRGSAPGAKSILILQSFGQRFEPFSAAASVFRTELALRSSDPIEFYEVSLETARFAEGDVDHPLADYVQALCARVGPHLVVPVGAPALRFYARHHDQLFPDVPVLVTAVDQRHLTGVDLGDHGTAVTMSLDLVGAIDDILHLLPATHSVTVVLGSSPLEQYWAAETRRAWRGFAGRVEFAWLDGLTLPEMTDRVAHLPPGSAVFFGLLNVDAAGVPYEGNVALERLCHAANAPVFGLFEPQMGLGVVGGRMIDVRRLGEESAHVAIRILDGESPSSIPPLTILPAAAVFDARELKRWGIAEALLPSGSEVRFREPSLWEVYRWRIIALGAILAAETILIAMLLSSHVRLRSTRVKLGENEKNVQDLRRELNHVGRVSLLGQVTTSLAHELGQPLGAILRNAEAAELFMKGDHPDLEEVRAILADVRKDTARAGAVIERLRALLKRRSVDMQALAWGDLVEETMAIVRGDASGRGIVLDSVTPPGLPSVRGDRVHLQQVLINLVGNAMEAMDGAGAGERRITVRARSNGNGFVECTISDTGEGIPEDRLAAIFDPFVTTKPDGMGMGLPISRTIVEAHGGRLWATNNAGGGVTFHFTIPSTRLEKHHA